MFSISDVSFSDQTKLLPAERSMPDEAKELVQARQNPSSVEKHTPNYDQLDIGGQKKFEREAAVQAQWDEAYDRMASQNPEYRLLNNLKSAVDNCVKEIENSRKLHQDYESGISKYQKLLSGDGGVLGLTDEQKREYTFRLADLQKKEQSLEKRESENGVPDRVSVWNVSVYSSMARGDSNFAKMGSDVHKSSTELEKLRSSASCSTGGADDLKRLLANMAEAIDRAWNFYHNRLGNEPNAPDRLIDIKDFFHPGGAERDTSPGRGQDAFAAYDFYV